MRLCFNCLQPIPQQKTSRREVRPHPMTILGGELPTVGHASVNSCYDNTTLVLTAPARLSTLTLRRSDRFLNFISQDREVACNKFGQTFSFVQKIVRDKTHKHSFLNLQIDSLSGQALVVSSAIYVNTTVRL